jgi:Na+-translocating ferredoxin:NAD+ oxidoreductase RnfA subunit
VFLFLVVGNECDYGLTILNCLNGFNTLISLILLDIGWGHGSSLSIVYMQNVWNHKKKSDAFIPLNGSGMSLTAENVIAYFPFI